MDSGLLLLAALACGCEIIDSSLGMLYGTILSPALITAGYNPVAVIPSILLSQAIGGFIASVKHHKLGHVEYRVEKNIRQRLAELGYIETFKRSLSRDLKVVFIISAAGVLATCVGALTAVSIPKTALKTYIGVLVIVMGVVLLSRSVFGFSWKKIFGVGVLSAFNKGISGGGFGPVVTTGQLIAGRRSKETIGATTSSEIPICLTGFATYVLTKGIPSSNLLMPLLVGATVGGWVGPRITAKFRSERRIKTGLGVLVIALGLYTLIKTWVL